MCTKESEAMLEKKLIESLITIGYQEIKIKDEKELYENLKTQLEIHNDCKLSESEFKQVVQYLDKGSSVFERSKRLREKVLIHLDNGTTKRIELLNSEKWCKNEFQVTSQVSIDGKFLNRYDVTILINGLPLVQIELKRRGIELKEAYNQIVRYNRHTMNRGLFAYVQIFVISNGVNTKYYANNKDLETLWKQTFYWTDIKNNVISNLDEFTLHFLDKCHLSKMICKYIVLHKTNKCLMMLRPYQYYAVEKMIDRVENTNKNGYIWHTTGSGKTLTAFKASQLLRENEKVYKVLFVVDRNDLDYQTMKEFEDFEKDSVSGTDSTYELTKHLVDPTKPLLITTIQKLNNAVSRLRYNKKLEEIKDKKFVFIFDECHRSQFGDTHTRITEYFTNRQLFGFTGTPIFVQNAIKGKTTVDLFDEMLHDYTIKNAIEDENVLGFSVEYIGKYKENENSKRNIDIEVEDIDTKEVLESEKRIEKIVDFILNNHKAKTFSKYQSIFAVDNVKLLMKYYEIFDRKLKEIPEENRLKIATIFSYQANEDVTEEGSIEINESESAKPVEFARDALDRYIKKYNELFETNFSLKESDGYSKYFVSIAKNMKEQKIDILLVVNMFLTGFDSKTLNTLYVDKSLRNQGLIQAFSRTNRILNEHKKHGNIVCFRNLKDKVDGAIALYSNNKPIEKVLMKSYDEYLQDFINALERLKKITPTFDDVNSLVGEDEEREFIEAFRNLIRLRNRLETFTDFSYENLGISEFEFDSYQSKYLDIYREKKKNFTKDKVSILDDIDFELELIARDEINVQYILNLLKKLNKDSPNFVKDREFILSTINASPELKSKKELIELFINEQLPNISDEADFDEKFNVFMTVNREEEFNKFIESEGLKKEPILEFIENYEFSGKEKTELLKEAFLVKPKLQERQEKVKNMTKNLIEFIKKYSF